MALNYYEDGVDRILRVLKDALGNKYQYFNGELINIGESYLPAIMVTQTALDVDVDATGLDVIQETILIIVSFNLKDDIGADPNTQLTDYKIRKLVQAQDPTTKQYIPESILGAIRTHFTMDSDTLEQAAKVEYSPNVRGEKSDIATQEAYITIEMRRLVPVPMRT